MTSKIYVSSKIPDTRAQVLKKKLSKQEKDSNITDLALVNVYTINKSFTKKQLAQLASLVSNPVSQQTYMDSYPGPSDFAYAIEIGFLPGVTDNVGNTVKEIIQDFFKIKLSDYEGAYSSIIYFINGTITRTDIEKIAQSLHNPLIQKAYIWTAKEFKKNKGSTSPVPKVELKNKPHVSEINLNTSDKELERLGQEGIKNPDGTSRGPLALHLVYMKAIQTYFKKQDRNPTDIELESLAQTWSEHCKHTIFADPIDDIKDGLYKTYIKGATQKIREMKGKDDFCVSVFKDNSGAIAFDDDYLVTHKVETHNSPSALDPFGGAITGIVGVNRDAIGFGLGAKPIANFYGFCLGFPEDTTELYRDQKRTQKMLSARRIMDGVIEGTNAGGNTSGIPTPLGFVYFDQRYRGKPLVFGGTVGLIPRKVGERPSHKKKALPGDYIVMIGGRVGIDGIHGATFSSQEIHEGSPATAVQIGDPITQKKLSDAIVREAREMNLYSSITDDGAGGLSGSVAEMAKEAGGAQVDLDKVPLKYVGLDPWQIWISESQERMTLSIPPKNWKRFKKLMYDRGVEATVIGTFTDSRKCVVRYNGKKIMDIDMDFLHDGLPHRPMKTTPSTKSISQAVEPTRLRRNEETGKPRRLDETFLNMLSFPNNTSYEFISTQYDHEVQGTSVIKPLVGKGRVNSEVTFIRPVLSSKKALGLSYGLYPSYSDISAYDMAAAAIDTAVRNLVASGVSLDQIALLDNFCWPSGDDPQRLWQLKEAARACYNYAYIYQTPFISGKDSMFNDFKGYDSKGNKIKISVPPTLLISSLGIVNNVSDIVTSDFKSDGDLVYLLGSTYDELGGSQYLLSMKKSGGKVPETNAQKNKSLYEDFSKAAKDGLITSSIAVTRGGLAIALAKSALAGMLGASIQLKDILGGVDHDDITLFSESQGRILVTVSPKNQKKFEKVMKNHPVSLLGKVTDDKKITVKGIDGKTIINAPLETVLKSYKKTFKDY